MGAGSGAPLPPSRFGAGYTSGAPPTPTAVPPTAAVGPSPGGHVAPVAPAVPPVGVPAAGGATPGAPSPQAQHTNALAAVALALVLLFGVFAVPATIPMGLVARSQLRRTPGGNAATANAALIIGLIYLIIGLTAVALWFVIPDAPTTRAGGR